MDGVEIGRVTFNFVALAISICYRVLDLRLYTEKRMMEGLELKWPFARSTEFPLYPK